jgi:hypothetical protein
MLYVLAHAQHNRSGIAFAQHYSVRASERGLVPKGDAAWNSDYTERTFGIDTSHDATHVTASIGDFARAKPRLFLRHILTNLCDSRTVLFLPLVLAVGLWPWFRKDLRPLRAASAFFLVICVPPLADIVVIHNPACGSIGGAAAPEETSGSMGACLRIRPHLVSHAASPASYSSGIGSHVGAAQSAPGPMRPQG